MSRKLLCAILYICALAASAYGQQDADVFDDAAYDSYSKACDLNDAKDFMAAYRFILQADQAVNASLSKKRLEASRLDDSQYRYPYWAVKKSRAEIAYMLGLHSDMEAMKNELSLSLKEKTWREADGAADIRKGLWADLAKIDGSRYYMTEKYAASEAALKSALELGGFHGNEYFICICRLNHISSFFSFPCRDLFHRDHQRQEHVSHSPAKGIISPVPYRRYYKADS